MAKTVQAISHKPNRARRRAAESRRRRTVSTPARAELPKFRPGPRLKFAWLDKKLLKVDGKYQREISERGRALIRDIVANFNWAKFGCLTVTPTGRGYYNVIDGQHRSVSANEVEEIVKVPCLVVLPALDVRGQSELFSHTNAHRVAMSPLNIFWAGVTARNAVCLEVWKVAKEGGVTLARRQGIKQPLGVTSAISAIRHAIAKSGRDATIAALSVLRNTQIETTKKVGDAVDGLILGGNCIRAAAIAIANRKDAIAPARLMRALVSLGSAEEWIDKGRERRRSAGGGGTNWDPMAALLLEAYDAILATPKEPATAAAA